ncbi:MAG: long-chain-fatty-acid--CoA ligase [Candidatus Kariarchaeaceae archaeon]
MPSTSEIPTPWLTSLEGVRPTTLEYEQVPPFEFVKRRANNNPDDPCMTFAPGKVSVTYAELMDSIKRLAVVLTNNGIAKGDRVCVLLPNTPHYVISHYAILSIGAIVVQGNPIYTKRELTHQINDSGATGIISLTLFQDKVNEVMQETELQFAILGTLSDYIKPIIAFLGKLLRKLDDPKMKSIQKNYLWKKSLSDANPSNFEEVEVDLEDIALLQYTGGTTGAAKGAMLTHSNISINSQQTRSLIHMIPDKTGSVLTVLPLFHSFALTCCLGLSFQSGIPMILMPRFDASDALKYIESFKISFVPAVPTMMIALLNHPDVHKRDLSSLIGSFSGGAALPMEVAKQFNDVTGGDLVEGYGLSETSPVVTGNPMLDEKLKPRMGSIGLPTPDTLLKIVDTDDFTKDLPIGEVGEIAIKGPQVMKGYWGNEKATSTVLKEGWLLTGDIGRVDDEGYFYIVDRKKDLIIVSGNNVVPREIEEILYEHPAILEGAVAGLPHDIKGEMVVAWVVLKEGMSATEEEIIEFCRDKLAPYKLPKEVRFRDELPKTLIGKILRRKLQEEG